MGDGRTFKDAFARRDPPAKKRLGSVGDKFLKHPSEPKPDHFKQSAPAANTADAFAPKAKPPKLEKPQKIVRPTSRKTALAVAKPQASAKLDPLGRPAAQPPKRKALQPLEPAFKPGKPALRGRKTAPVAPMTRPLGKTHNPFARTPAPAAVLPVASNDTGPAAPPAPTIEPAAAAIPHAEPVEAARAPLQVVAGATETRKLRRAPRSSSLVLVSGAGADPAFAERHTGGATDETGPGITYASSDSDTLAGDKKPVAPAAEPTAQHAAPVQPAAAPPPSASAAAEPPKPPPPQKDVELVEPTVEPVPTPKPDPKGEPIGVAAATATAAGGAASAQEATETGWEAVDGQSGAADTPASATLEKVERSEAGGFWAGATINRAKSEKAQARRGFNHDDAFGLMFGLAVLVFLLMWLFRGRGDVPPDGEEILTAQNAPSQAAAPLLAAPAPPPPDPFAGAPVDLRPSGPIPEPLPPVAAEPAPSEPAIAAVTPTPAPAAPVQPAQTPPAAATPAPSAPLVGDSTLALAGGKMHAWFCTASARLTNASYTALDAELEKFSGALKGKELVVRGYADTRGAIALNADLGERRAQRVARLLTARGFTVVDAAGVGELDGLDDNQNCPNQRRVDVWVKGEPLQPSRACTAEPEFVAPSCVPRAAPAAAPEATVPAPQAPAPQDPQ